MRFEINTNTTINANPSAVWKVLTDFDEYPEWNTFVKRLKGNVQVGNIVEVDLPGMTFKPVVRTFDHQKEFKWAGKLWFKGLFDGEHRFYLQQNEDGSTLFSHSEKFKGLLVGLLKKKLIKETIPAFEEMNAALKKRVEEMT